MGGEVLGGLDGGAGGGEEDVEGVDEVLGVAVLEAVAIGVVVAEGGDAVVGEGLGHVVHEGGVHGGSGAVAEDEEGEGVGGLEEEGGEVGAGGGVVRLDPPRTPGRLTMNGWEGGLVEFHWICSAVGFGPRRFGSLACDGEGWTAGGSRWLGGWGGSGAPGLSGALGPG